MKNLLPSGRRSAGRFFAGVLTLLAGLPLLGQAQTTLSLWPLETNASPTTTATGITSTAPTLADLVLPGTASLQYTAVRGQSVSPVNDGSGWTGVALLRSRYEQFAVTAATGYSSSVQTISLNTGVISTANGRLGVSYSTDPAFATFSEATSVTQPSGSPAATGSFASPVTLPNLSSGTGTSGTAAATTAYSFQLGASGTGLTSGQTLYIRLYYNANTTSASRYALVRNVAVSGTVTANGPACASVTGLMAGSITATTASVSFTPGASNTSYTVTVTPTGGSTTTISPNPTASPVSISGLAPSTEYTVTVRSTCSNGGNGSVVSTVFTTLAPPFCADPTNVSIGNRTATSAQLLFTAGSLNTSYVVTITPQGGSTTTISPAPTASPVTFNGLTSGTAYTVTLRSNCNGNSGIGSLITRTFVAPVANSTVLQAWPLTSSNADDAGQRSAGIFTPPAPPTFTGLTSSTGTLPAYSADNGQAFAPAANGGGWNGDQALDRTRYEEFTIKAGGTYTLRVDSLILATAIQGSANGHLGVSFSTDGFTSNIQEISESSTGTPATTPGAFNATVANTITLNNVSTGPLLAAGNTYRFALKGTAGVTVAPLGTLTIRLYYSVGSTGSPRYAMLRDVLAKGQATFTAPTCNDPSALIVSNVNENSARLSFTPGSGNTSYTVTVTPQGGSATTISPAPTSSPINLSGLAPSTSYTVALQANCSTGGLQSGTVSTSFTTSATVLQRWSLRLTDQDSAAVRSAGVTASTRTGQGIVPADGSTSTAPAHSAKYGLAAAPTAAGLWTVAAGGPGANPNANNYLQFTVTATNASNVRVEALNMTTSFLSSANGKLAVAYSLDGFASAGTDVAGGTAVTTNPAYTGPVTSTFASPISLSQPANTSTAPNIDTYHLVLNGSTGITLTPGQTLTLRLYYSTNSSSSGRYALLRDVNVEGALLPATVPDLTVSAAQSISGTYNNVTITGTGIATLNGNLTINGTLTVQSGGTLAPACQTVSGPGSFMLAPGATLLVCNANGISSSGANGAVQTSGSRSFSPDANYVYNGTTAQLTGNGLPTTVRSLTVNNSNGLTLSQAVSVAQLARLQSGSLTTGGNAFTLLSSASGTAVLDNTGGIVVGSGTMQRAITSSITGPAYRHFSAPTSNATVADLATAGFAPVVNPTYNSAAQPNLVTPFPTVFGYDESRIASVTSTYSAFAKGWVSPASLSSALTPSHAYTVNAPATATPIDFVGTFNNAAQGSGTLTRGTDAQAGYHLLGNPYPSPIDWSTVGAAQRPGMDATMYVYESSGQYTGTYRTYTNGVGGASPIIAAGSGYFARVSVAGTTGSVSLTNANRVTTFGTQPAFGRGTADTRPQLQLQVSGAGVQDEAFVYFQNGVTAALDAEYDALKMPNTTGLNLSSLAGTESLAINGLPALAANTATVLPLTLYVPQAGAFTFTVPTLANFGSTQVYLRDAATGSHQLLTAGAGYAFQLTTAMAGTTRFALEFRATGALATQAGLATSLVQVYPNPAHGSFTVLLPPVAGQQAVQATLLNALGQVVATRSIALTAAGASSEFDVQSLAAGVYALRVQAGSQVITQRVVVK